MRLYHKTNYLILFIGSSSSVSELLSRLNSFVSSLWEQLRQCNAIYDNGMHYSQTRLYSSCRNSLCTHTHEHNTHTRTHARTHACTHAHTHTHARTHKTLIAHAGIHYAHIHMNTTRTHRQWHTHTHRDSGTHARTHARTHLGTHIHAHTNRFIHTYICCCTLTFEW